MGNQESKASKPILNISTADREYKTIEIDNASYRLIHIDDMTLKDYADLKALSNMLSKGDEGEINTEQYLDTLNRTIRFILPTITDEVCDKLSIRQKNRIIEVFTREAFPEMMAGGSPTPKTQ